MKGFNLSELGFLPQWNCLINLITNKKIARERLKFSSIYLCLRSLFCVCFSHAGTECHVVLPHTDRVFEVQWRAGGGSLQLCPGHHPHVLHTVLWHLHLLHVSKKVQDEPIFPHHCELACWANLTEQATRRGPNEIPCYLFREQQVTESLCVFLSFRWENSSVTSPSSWPFLSSVELICS